MKRSRKLAAAALIAAGAAGASVGFAFASPTTVVGFGQILQVSQTSSGGAETTTSHSFVNLPGGSQSIPTKTSGIVLARFSAESACRGSSGGWCSVRLLVDGHEMTPVVGTDFAFDSVSTGFGAHSMERNAVVGVGAHSVTVQFAAVGGATTFRLDDWTLNLESSAANH